MSNLIDHIVEALWGLHVLAFWSLAVVEEGVDHDVVVQRVRDFLLRSHNGLDSPLPLDFADDWRRRVVP